MPTMPIEADAHAHLYAVHAPDDAFDAAVRHLTAPVRALWLTEAAGCRFFRALARGEVPCSRWSGAVCPEDPSAVRMERSGDGAEVFVIAGRQIVARERVEILAWGRDAEVPDGLSAAETVEAVRAAGATPALAWAPGKWMFARAAVVEALLRRFEPAALWLCDSSLRPPGWPEPAPMRRARGEGRPVLAGTDPLPFPGEERRQGQYAIRLEGAFDARQPAVSMLRLAAAGPAELIGARSGWVDVFRRLRRHAAARHARAR